MLYSKCFCTRNSSAAEGINVNHIGVLPINILYALCEPEFVTIPCFVKVC